MGSFAAVEFCVLDLASADDTLLRCAAWKGAQTRPSKPAAPHQREHRSLCQDGSPC